MRQAFKTIIGILVIGLIVVATFLYGNKQRQNQLRHDAEAKARQEQPAVSVTPTPAVSTSTAGSTDQAPSGATAAVPKQSGPSDLQASASHDDSASPVVAAAPTKSIAPTTIPDTGMNFSFAPLATMIMVGLAYTLRNSKSRLRQAALHVR